MEKFKKEVRILKNDLENARRDVNSANEEIRILHKEFNAKVKSLAAANKELQKIDQLKSDFVSTVSHELRTPLSITKEGISLILDKVPGSINEAQKKLLVMSSDNLYRLERIINDLLDISKIEAGKMELRRVLVDISGMVNNVCARWKLKSKKKHQFLGVSTPRLPVNIYVDPDRITQVIDNLLSNAIKYTPEKGKINVELKHNKEQIEISVSDTGIGISEENLSKLFSKFQQFTRTTGPGPKGTGLGLSIIKELIGMHKGSIKVESNLNKGSRFTFSLPRIDTDEVFKEYVKNGIKEAAEREKGFLSLVVIHVGNFGKIRENVGYEKAHNLLKDIEMTAKDCLRRRADTVLRDTGDFIVFLSDTPKKSINVVRERIEKALHNYVVKNRKKWIRDIAVTIGNATYPDDAKNEEELVDGAKRHSELLYTDAEHREGNRRRKMEFDVRYSSVLGDKKTKFAYAATRDLSAEGIGIFTKNMLKPQTKLFIRFPVPSQNITFEMEGEVAWSRKSNERKGFPYRTGVRLIGLKEKAKRVILELIK